MLSSAFDQAYAVAKKIGDDTVVQLALGVLGVFLAIYLYKRQQASAKRRKLTFDELMAAAKRLATKARGFDPTILFSCDSRGGLWADIIAERLNTKAPVFVGTRYHRLGRIFSRPSHSARSAIALVGQRTPKQIGMTSSGYLKANFFMVETERWILYVPNTIRDFNSSRMLIVDDYSFTGETSGLLKKAMIDEFGFQPDAVRTLTIVTTSHARAAGRLPDFYDIVVDNDDFDLPYMSRE